MVTCEVTADHVADMVLEDVTEMYVVLAGRLDLGDGLTGSTATLPKATSSYPRFC